MKTKLPLSSYTRRDSIFAGLKRPEVYPRSVDVDVGVPEFITRRPTNTHNTAGVSGVYALVFSIRGVRCCAKIFLAVVASVMVYMVDLIRGSFSVKHDPYNSMRKVCSAIYGTLLVTPKIISERLFACPASVPLWAHIRSILPKQFSGFTLIGKPLMQISSGWYFCKSHLLRLAGLLEFNKMQWSPSSPLRRKGSLPLPCGGVGGVPLPAADAVTHRS